MKRIPAMLLRASALLLILLPAASCTDTLGDAPDTDAGAITFTPAAETRTAVDGANFPAGSSFSVWGWYGQGSDIDRNVFDDQTVTENNGAWTYEGGYQYWIAGMTYNFYGVYPSDAKAEVDAQGTVTVTDFDCSKTGAEAVDLMTAEATGLSGTAAPTVAMKFEHELARVKFQAKTQGSEVIITSFKINGVGYKGDFSRQLPSGAAQWTSEEATTTNDGIFSATNLTIENTNEETITDLLGDLLILPQTLEADKQQLSISYRYEGEADDRTKTADLLIENSITGWTAGQSYVYTLDLRNASLILTVTIQDWTKENADVSWKPTKP